MDVYCIDAGGLSRHTPADLPELIKDPDVIVWIDLPLCADAESQLLKELFGFHELAVRDCGQRSHISKIHVYDDHVFTVLHAPELGTGGHVHYVELDQFIGTNYLVTVHGPHSANVNPRVALLDTRHVLERVERHNARPRSAAELSGWVVASMLHREIDMVAALAGECGRLEQHVTSSDQSDDPEMLLEDLFEVSHQLLAIRTIANHSAEVYRSMSRRIRSIADEDKPLISDLADRFEMLRSMADGQKEFVHGVIEFYQTRTSTHLTIAAEQLSTTSINQNDDMRKISAWVAIIAVPTAVTGFFGQNIPYPGFNDRAGFIASMCIMLVAAVVLYFVFRRKKWL